MSAKKRESQRGIRPEAGCSRGLRHDVHIVHEIRGGPGMKPLEKMNSPHILLEWFPWPGALLVAGPPDVPRQA